MKIRFYLCKQCRSWWNAAWCSISSGSTLFDKVPVSPSSNKAHQQLVGILTLLIKAADTCLAVSRMKRGKEWHFVSQESKPRNSDFYQNVSCQRGNTKSKVHILSNSRSSRPIRTPLKSINLASKYHIYERYHYFGAHFTKIRCFAMKKMLKIW